MSNQNVIVVVDLETGGLDVERCEVLEVACLALDPRTLEELPGSRFSSLVRPLDFGNLDPEAMRVNGISTEEMEGAPERGAVWAAFAAHVKGLNRKGGQNGRPIPCGKNIANFDLPILLRLAREHGHVDKDGKSKLWHPRRVLELEGLLWPWFENSTELADMRMDTLRDYFGMASAGAHRAMADVVQTADLVVRVLKLHRAVAPKVSFRNACRQAG